MVSVSFKPVCCPRISFSSVSKTVSSLLRASKMRASLSWSIESLSIESFNFSTESLASTICFSAVSFLSSAYFICEFNKFLSFSFSPTPATSVFNFFCTSNKAFSLSTLPNFSFSKVASAWAIAASNSNLLSISFVFDSSRFL